MTSDLGGAVLTLSTDISQLSSGIDTANSKIESLGSTAENIESKLTFTQLAVSFDAVIQGISRMTDAVSSAYGHLTLFTQGLAYVHKENMSIKLIFGEAADAIFDFGQTASTSVGLSAKAFNELVAPLGSLLTNVAGLTKTDAAGWAIELAKRASDLAFVFNVDVNQAMTAVGAAVRGEVEPIRALGVSFNAVMVEAKAMAMTGKDNAEALTEQDKAMARLMLVMDQTSELSGVFASNTDLLFQKQQKLTAEIQNLSGELGAKLIPYNIMLIDLFTKMPGSVQLAAYAIATFGGDVINMVAGLGQAAVGFAGLITAVPQLGAAFAALNISMTAALGVLGLVVIAVGGAYLAWQHFSGGAKEAEAETQKLRDAQHLLTTSTTENITATRNEIAAMLEKKIADGESKASIDATKDSLYIYNLALGLHSTALEEAAGKTDGVTTAAEEMLGVVDKGTPVISDFDLALDGVNAAFETMYSKANDAFGAINQFKDVPTAESIALDLAIAGVNLRLADEKVALDNAKRAGDELAAGIHETNITALEAEKEEIGHSKDAMDAARDMAIKMGEAKYGASDAAGALGKTEADWRYAIDDYARSLSGQASQAAEARQKLLDAIQAVYDAGYAFAQGIGDAAAYASYLYGIATAADTARGQLEYLQQVAANPVSVPVISPGQYSAPFPGQAAGTGNWSGGVTWVGEKGPELVNLPKGAQVLSNAQSMSLVGRAGHLASGTMGGGGGGGGLGRIPPWITGLVNGLTDVSSAAQVAEQAMREFIAAIRNEGGVGATEIVTMFGSIGSRSGDALVTAIDAFGPQFRGALATYLEDVVNTGSSIQASLALLPPELRAIAFDMGESLLAGLTPGLVATEQRNLATTESLIAMWAAYVETFSYTPQQLDAYYSNMQESLRLLGEGFQGIIAKDFSIVPAQFYEVGKGAAEGFADGIAPLTPFLDSVAEAVAIWGDGIVSEMTETFKQALAISAQIAAAGASGSAVPVLGTATATRYSGSAAPPLNGPTATPSHSGTLTQADMDYINQMNANNAYASYAHGTPFVPRNMVARLHRGERVVTAEDNRRGGSGGMSQNVYGPQQIVLPNVRNHDDFMQSLDRLAW